MTAPNDEGLTATNDQPPKSTQPSDASITDLDASRKQFATLAALLALKGYALHELACGGFLICRWDRTAHCSDLGAVHGFLRKIGGA